MFSSPAHSPDPGPGSARAAQAASLISGLASLSPGDAALARPDQFAAVQEAAARAPLTDIAPQQPADQPAALGFALAWLAGLAAGSSDGATARFGEAGLLVCILPERMECELGTPCPEGLASFGLPLERLILMRTRSAEETLWAAEETLAVPRAAVLAIIPPRRKPMGLGPTRRLLLRAGRGSSRCVLLRLDPFGASSAWTRWIVAAAPSRGSPRELGAPAFCAKLDRNRAGPAGLSWIIAWNAMGRRFDDIHHPAEGAMDGARISAAGDRPAAARTQDAA